MAEAKHKVLIFSYNCCIISFRILPYFFIVSLQQAYIANVFGNMACFRDGARQSRRQLSVNQEPQDARLNRMG